MIPPSPPAGSLSRALGGQGRGKGERASWGWPEVAGGRRKLINFYSKRLSDALGPYLVGAAGGGGPGGSQAPAGYKLRKTRAPLANDRGWRDRVASWGQ